MEIVAGAVLISFLLRLRKRLRGSLLFPILYLPPTILHELSHFIVALLLGGKPSPPDIIPKRRGNLWILGSVRFVPTPLNAFPSSMAPVFLIPVSVLFFTCTPFPLNFLLAWFSLEGALPSRQDVRIAFSYPVSAVLWLLLLLLILQTLSEELLSQAWKASFLPSQWL